MAPTPHVDRDLREYLRQEIHKVQKARFLKAKKFALMPPDLSPTYTVGSYRSIRAMSPEQAEKRRAQWRRQKTRRRRLNGHGEAQSRAQSDEA